jgi:hypothetical protein
MLERHEHLLYQRLEQVLDYGVATITWRELYRWYDKERLTKTVYLDIFDRWREVLKRADEDVKTPLLMGDQNNASGCLTLVLGTGLKTDNSWLRDKRSWEEQVEAA